MYRPSRSLTKLTLLIALAVTLGGCKVEFSIGNAESSTPETSHSARTPCQPQDVDVNARTCVERRLHIGINPDGEVLLLEQWNSTLTEESVPWDIYVIKQSIKLRDNGLSSVRHSEASGVGVGRTWEVKGTGRIVDGTFRFDGAPGDVVITSANGIFTVLSSSEEPFGLGYSEVVIEFPGVVTSSSAGSTVDGRTVTWILHEYDPASVQVTARNDGVTVIQPWESNPWYEGVAAFLLIVFLIFGSLLLHRYAWRRAEAAGGLDRGIDTMHRDIPSRTTEWPPPQSGSDSGVTIFYPQ